MSYTLAEEKIINTLDRYCITLLLSYKKNKENWKFSINCTTAAISIKVIEKSLIASCLHLNTTPYHEI